MFLLVGSVTSGPSTWHDWTVFENATSNPMHPAVSAQTIPQHSRSVVVWELHGHLMFAVPAFSNTASNILYSLSSASAQAPFPTWQ